MITLLSPSIGRHEILVTGDCPCLSPGTFRPAKASAVCVSAQICLLWHVFLWEQQYLYILVRNVHGLNDKNAIVKNMYAIYITLKNYLQTSPPSQPEIIKGRILTDVETSH